MISRFFIIVMALLAAGIRASQAAWVEAIGLAALGIGLALLRASETRPGLRRWAFLAFFVTAAAVVTVFYRSYL